jgi:hypothetical protein
MTEDVRVPTSNKAVHAMTTAIAGILMEPPDRLQVPWSSMVSGA